MKKVLSVMAVSAFVLTAGVALAGGPGKQVGPGCPEACQKQIDDLQSSQAQQDELLNAHGRQLQNPEGRITELETAFNDYWYVRLGVRAAWMKQTGKYNDYPYNVIPGTSFSTDAGFGGAIAFGREFSMYQAPGKFRAEIELAKQRADFDKNFPLDGPEYGVKVEGTVDVSTIFINGYYELPVVDAFSFYVMAGLGYAKYDVDADISWYEPGSSTVLWRGGASDNVFAYKAGVGVTWNFTDQIAADLGYEYLGVADTDIADSINGHNVVLSVRFKF